MKWRTPKYAAIFLIVGILLLALSYFASPKAELRDFLTSSLSQIAFVVLTVSILDFAWSLLGGEPIRRTLDDLQASVDLLSDSHKTGIRRVYAVSGEFANFAEWMAYLKSARRTVDLMGYTLHVWTRGQNFEEEIIQLAKAGVNIRVQIMSAENPSFGAIVNAKQISSISPGSVREEIKTMTAVLKGLEEKTKAYSGRLVFRPVSRGLIVNQICRFDGVMTIIPYLWSITASESPLLLVQGTDSRLFRTFMNEFEKLWGLNEPSSVPVGSAPPPPIRPPEVARPPRPG